MEFVNSIAKIVHMEVSLHGGAPNKNIGDAFLLVWKLPKGFTSRDIPRIKEQRKPSVEPEIVLSQTELHEHTRDGSSQELTDMREPKKSRQERGSCAINIHAFGGARPVSFGSPQSKSPSGKLIKLRFHISLVMRHDSIPGDMSRRIIRTRLGNEDCDDCE